VESDKLTMRARLRALTISEKLRILDALRERWLLILKSRERFASTQEDTIDRTDGKR